MRIYHKLFFLSLILAIACRSNIKDKREVDSTTSVQILKRAYSFGTIHTKDSVEHSFLIKNVGNIPLIIKKATSSCGCTVPEWPRKPILPNDTAIIKVKFIPNKGFEGVISKSIVIQANTDSTFHVLYLKGNVETDK